MSRLAQDPEDLRKKVMEACIGTFNEKGIRLTMSDVATRCHISKKTLYLMFDDKEEMLLNAIDHCFDSIKECEKEIYDDPDLSTLEKIKKIMGIMPDRYRDIDFTKGSEFKDVYPSLYKRINERLSNDWDYTISLIERGIKEGVIRSDISIYVLKAVIEGAIDNMLSDKGFKKAGLTYAKALDELIEMIINGIRAR